MENNYYYIDLHVHTVASNDWKGSKTDEEYLNIVKSAIDNKIDLICIADHNTIEGYKKIMERKNSTYTIIQVLKQRNDADRKYLNQLEEEYALFNSVHILLGIELNISPGIHYVIVFKENVDVKNVEAFLLKLMGQNKTLLKAGLSDHIIHNFNTIQFFDLAENYFEKGSFFIYAPHCDSNSGLIEALKDLKAERLNILKDSRLLCLGFNKEESRNYVVNNLIPHIIKERNTVLHFIQDSDYHGGPGEKIGSQLFLIEKEKGKISFQTLYDRLLTSDSIKTTIETGLERYHNFIKNKYKIDFDTITLENIEKKKDDLCKTINAILNSEKSAFIHFEVDVKREKDPTEEVEQIIEYLKKLIKNELNIHTDLLNHHLFQVSKSKLKVVVSFFKSDRLSLYGGKCYIFNNKNFIEVASSNQVEAIVAKKIYEKYGKPKDRLLDEITTNSSTIKNYLLSLSNVYFIDNHIDKFSKYKVKMLQTNNFSERILHILFEQLNGYIEGNTILIDKMTPSMLKGGRFSDSYLRVSAPTYKIPEDIQGNFINKNSILIIPEGGVFYVEKDSNLLTDIPVFQLTIEEEVINPKIMTAYLKSSFLQWFLCKINNYKDIFHFILRMKLYIPFINKLEQQGHEALEEIIEKILKLEKDFIKKSNLIHDDEELSRYIEEHNDACEKLMFKIDNILFDLLGFSEETRKSIYQDLSNLSIYVFNYQKYYTKTP